MNRRLRRLFAGVLLALSLPVAHAQSTGREWSNVDLTLAALSITAHTLDWGQTRYIAANPDRYRETNVFLGEHPTRGQVDAYFLLYGAAVATLAHYFPEYRKIILAVHFGMHGQAVSSNFRIGIRMSF
jgi:hypothetical protein